MRRVWLVIAWVGSGCAGAAGLPGNQDTSVFSGTATTPMDTDDESATDTDTMNPASNSSPPDPPDPIDTDSTDSDPSDSDPSDTDPSDTDPSDTDPTGVEPGCGNAIVEGTEQCDLGDENSDTGPCKLDCTNQVCGDGFIGPGEGCDDANVVNDDACNNACLPTSCGDGAPNNGEQCDDGNGDNTDACPQTCQNAFCGDSFVQAGVESCDEGAATAGCDGDCTPVQCGDGTANAAAGEQCDDGNGNTNDACPNCNNAFCGDGFVQSGVEACDDGNGNNGDGCSGACQPEFPNQCDGGTDPVYGSGWVVCSADANGAWISANDGGGFYHPTAICQSLGYSDYSVYGGNCNSVCGFCDGATNCMAHGQQIFEGSGYCGDDGLGMYLCFTVTWFCVN